MSDPGRPRKVLVAMIVVAILAAAAFWLPRWWENRLYRQAEAMTGVGSRVLAGGVTSARGRIEPGKTAAQVVAAIGRPSFSVRTEGTSTHDIWTYYYADGTMTVNLTDDVVKRISLAYGPPSIPTSHRP
jgi:hypothetical protein